MAKFNVHVFQKIVEEAWIEIDAADPEDAKNAAIKKVRNEDVQWSFLGTCDEPVEVVDIEIDDNGRWRTLSHAVQ